VRRPLLARLALCALLSAVVLALSLPASGKGRLGRQAARLNRKAEAFFLKGELAKAEEHFTKAYAAEPNPTVLFNLGLCQEKQDRPLDAWRTYKRLLAEHSDLSFRSDVEARTIVLERVLAKTHTHLKLRTQPPGATLYLDAEANPAGETPYAVWLARGEHRVRLILEGHLTLEKELDLSSGGTSEQTLTLVAEGAPGRIELLEAGEGATVVLDGEPVGTTPDKATLEVSAGAHSLRLQRDGFAPFVAAAQVSAGATVQVRVTWVQLPSQAPARGQPGGSAQEAPARSAVAPLAAWLLGGTAVLAAGAGAALHAMAASSAADARDLSAPGSDPDAWQSKVDEADRRAGIAFASYGLAGAAAVAAGVVLLLDASDAADPEAKASTTVRLVPTLDAPGALLIATF